MKTTLNKLKESDMCPKGLEKLLKHLNKTEADDEELPLLTILESNGLDDAIWALRTVDGYEKEKRLMACDFAESVVHLAKDERCVNAIKVSRNYANGTASIEELYAAHHDADAAARAVTFFAGAGVASFLASAGTSAAAYAAAFSASEDYATIAATNYALDACDAYRDATEAPKKEKQVEILKKYL